MRLMVKNQPRNINFIQSRPPTYQVLEWRSIEQGRRKDEKSVKPASENECKKVVEMHVHQLVLTIVKLNLAMVLQCLF